MFTFTMSDALEIQVEQFAKWSKVLKPEVSIAMHEWLMVMNKHVKTPEQVRRGTDLDQFVANYMNGDTRQSFFAPWLGKVVKH